MRDLRASIEEAAAVWRARGFREFLVWNIEASPLRTRLLRDGAQPAAVDELLRELLDLADDLARRGELNLATFLDHLRASLDERKFREDGEAALPQGRVAVMTVHQARDSSPVAVVGVWTPNRELKVFSFARRGSSWRRCREGMEARQEEAMIHTLEEHMEDVEGAACSTLPHPRARLSVGERASSGRKEAPHTRYAALALHRPRRMRARAQHRPRDS
jgi:hypothetical protein